jgi:uncharacterized protein (UPF0335 family)
MAKKSDPAPFIEPDPPPNTSELARFLDRVENVEAEIKALREDVKEIWGEVKEEGFDVAMAKKAFSLRKMARENRLILGTYVDTLSLFE